jgi:hypothetical protein
MQRCEPGHSINRVGGRGESGKGRRLKSQWCDCKSIKRGHHLEAKMWKVRGEKGTKIAKLKDSGD